jgi:hypothetical protein
LAPTSYQKRSKEMCSASLDGRQAIDLVRAWYIRPDAILLASDFACRAIGYPTLRKTYTGPHGMLKEFFGEISAKYAVWEVNVDRIMDAGDNVTVIGSYSARIMDGPEETLPFVHVWSAENGVITAVVCCTDTR